MDAIVLGAEVESQLLGERVFSLPVACNDAEEEVGGGLRTDASTTAARYGISGPIWAIACAQTETTLIGSLACFLQLTSQMRSTRRRVRSGIPLHEGVRELKANGVQRYGSN